MFTRNLNPHGAAALDLLTTGNITYAFTPSIRPKGCYNLPVARLQRYMPISSSGLGFDPLFER